MDNDEIRQTIVRPWRRPARLATSKSPIEVVAREVERSLHRTLTADGEAGGCPGLHEIIEPLQQLHREYRRRPLLFPEVQVEARQRLVAQLQSVQEQHLHKHTSIAADIGRAISVAIVIGKANIGDDKSIALSVAQQFCRQLVDHYLFAQLRPILRRELGLSYSEARAWEQRLLEAVSPFVATTAARLLQDETGSRVKRPVRKRSIQSSTADLLNMNLLPARI